MLDSFELVMGSLDEFRFPDAEIFAATIRSQCSHFIEQEAIEQFCDLVMKLANGPEAPRKAVNFAEHLIRTHDFFLPLRVEATQQHAPVPFGEGEFVSDDATPTTPTPDEFLDELESIAKQLGGIHQSRNSLFQHLLARLRTLLHQSSPASVFENLLDYILTDIQHSNPTELSEKVNLGACEVFMKKLRARDCNFTTARKTLQIIFQILDSCPNQRHILMHLTHVERETGTSLLEYFVTFVSSTDDSIAAGADDAEAMLELKTSAFECVRKIVSSSIPYHSLSDFATSGCYGNPKMDSMLTARVLQSILTALNWPAAHTWAHHARGDLTIARLVLQVYFDGSEEADAFFVGQREAFRAMIRKDDTAQEFLRLFN